MTSYNSIESGRKAFREERWNDAFLCLSDTDSDALDAGDLLMLAVSAYLTGHFNESTGAWTSAHTAYLNEGNYARAVYCAFWLGFGLVINGESARGGAWFGRAHELVETHSPDGPEKGYLLIPPALRALSVQDPESAYTYFRKAGELGLRYRDEDLIALSKLGTGQALVRLYKTEEGLALLDAAMVAVDSGQLSPITMGIIYCAVIETCMEVFELNRAQEWTNVLSHWCESHPSLVPFRGQCLTRRSEIMLLHGRWDKAMAEIRLALKQWSEPPGQPAAGASYYQLGNLYRLLGEFDNAEKAYSSAGQYGRDPQPGLALLWLEQGQLSRACSAIKRALSETRQITERYACLFACLEIMLAADHKEDAAEILTDLLDKATNQDVPFLHALAAQSQGNMEVSEGEYDSALQKLREARLLWDQLNIPYRSARTRILMGQAYNGAGDPEAARMEFEAARSVFSKLGAIPDLKRAENFLRKTSDRATVLTAREKEVLQLIAEGKANKQIASDLFISKRTVERHVSNIFCKLNVSSRTAAAAQAIRHRLI